MVKQLIELRLELERLGWSVTQAFVFADSLEQLVLDKDSYDAVKQINQILNEWPKHEAVIEKVRKALDNKETQT